jgi:hypothetical protein
LYIYKVYINKNVNKLLNTSNISNISNDYIPLVEIKTENLESKSIFHSNETTKVIEFTKTKAIINSGKITISDYDDIMPINCNIHKIDQYKYLIKGSKKLAKEIAEKILNWKEYDKKIELKYFEENILLPYTIYIN